MISFFFQRIVIMPSGTYVMLSGVRADQVISVSCPLRRTARNVTVVGKAYRITSRGDTAIVVHPPEERDRLHQRAAVDTGTVPMKIVEKRLPVQSAPASPR